VGASAVPFEEWYEAQHPRLVATLLLATGNVDVARESADEAFTRALARWSRVGAMASPEAWTYRVAVNVAHRRWRRLALERRLLGRHPVSAVVPPPGEEAWDAVRRLPPRQRTAVVLRHVADLTEEDIAKVMGVTRGTVSSTLAAAHRVLAQLLASEEPEEVHRV
jgi:DNA-directed RNA polymerase specialized sigma24 family protein